MHLCYEILSLILLPLLPPLAAAIVVIIIIVIVHLMIIASTALPFCAKANPATPSSQPQWQIVSFRGGWWGHDVETPLLNTILCQHSFIVCLLSIVSDETPMTRPPELPHSNEDTRGGGHRDTPPPPPHNRHSYPCPRRSGGGTAPPPPPPLRAVPVMLRHGGLLHGPPAQHGCQVDDQCLRMWGAIFPSRGTLAGTARDLAAHRVVRLPGGGTGW
jgi:hypothetical protein